MGSLVSPIVANLYMKYFEREALHTASTPRQWFRLVHDTFVIQQESNKELFLNHINNIDPAIKSLSISVYRKPPILTSTYSGIVITI